MPRRVSHAVAATARLKITSGPRAIAGPLAVAAMAGPSARDGSTHATGISQRAAPPGPPPARQRQPADEDAGPARRGLHQDEAGEPRQPQRLPRRDAEAEQAGRAAPLGFLDEGEDADMQRDQHEAGEDLQGHADDDAGEAVAVRVPAAAPREDGAPGRDRRAASR